MACKEIQKVNKIEITIECINYDQDLVLSSQISNLKFRS